VSTQQLLLIAAAALGVFWMLGAYNRLVALRNGIIAAWAQVDEPLLRRTAALLPLAATLRPHLQDEQGTLDTVLAAQTELQSAADALRVQPALASRAARLVGAEARLQAGLSRLLALLEQRSGLVVAEDLAPHVAALHDASQRLAFARQLFNDAVDGYNEAARQFPTRLLSSLFGFGVAGKL